MYVYSLPAHQKDIALVQTCKWKMYWKRAKSLELIPHSKKSKSVTCQPLLDILLYMISIYGIDIQFFKTHQGFIDSIIIEAIYENLSTGPNERYIWSFKKYKKMGLCFSFWKPTSVP